MKRVVILASGSGSNAENIANYFKDNTEVKVSYIITNKAKAKVLERAERLQIPSKIFTKQEFLDGKNVVNFLKKEADLIILAGFLLKISPEIVQNFPNKIINIHPALLPKYGGKGMYGMNVHNAVVENKEKETGITIHFVNENYDEGAIIFQKSVEVTSEDTPENVAQKVHQLEYAHFPKVIEEIINNL
ncbi:phosphoribosylglycinamide formyltransferase [Aureivirga sp. CE67]|uniref:phosphoribosylglycinamide formyltransferase n=1 Tax=Aureivirga sp. CE67 TaxID=1788983 RepID=UPI0018C944DC|nr:phosphoribosylglycinamide formyltransferase [Aureivirga sp. CE67]